MQEEATLRELRLFLRDVLNKLGRDRKFSIFTKPVDEEEVSKVFIFLSGLLTHKILSFTADEFIGVSPVLKPLEMLTKPVSMFRNHLKYRHCVQDKSLFN